MTNQYNDYEIMWHHLRPKAKGTITCKNGNIDNFSFYGANYESND